MPFPAIPAATAPIYLRRWPMRWMHSGCGSPPAGRCSWSRAPMWPRPASRCRPSAPGSRRTVSNWWWRAETMSSMIDWKIRDSSPPAAASPPRLRIDGGRVLVGDRFETTSVGLHDGVIHDVGRDGGRDGGAARALDAGGLLVLPGIVDIHGDAFERQMMPRPGVHFALDIALMDTDRQVVANGITTVFHGVTWSWEPGLRSADNARAMLAAMEGLRL